MILQSMILMKMEILNDKSMNSLIKIQNAIETKKIAQTNDAELMLLIKKLCLMVSVQKSPEKELAMIVVDGIKRNFKGYALNEFVIAFELFIDGKLGLADHKHFQTFDFIYLRKIMDEYKIKFRGKAMIESRNANQLVLTETTTKKPIEEQQKDDYDYILNGYNKETKEFPKGSDFASAYDYAIIEKLIVLNTAQKKKIKEMTIKSLKSQMNSAKIKGLKIEQSFIKSILTNDVGIKTQCKIDSFKMYVKSKCKA